MIFRSLAALLIACAAASGCVSDESLYGKMREFRESEVRGRVDWMPIPGLSGIDVQCHAPATLDYVDGHSETLTYDPLIMHVDGIRRGIPVDYVCKAQEHPAATSKRGSVNVRAVLMPEVYCLDACDEAGDSKTCRQVAGYHVELLCLGVKECVK
ncbi:MAG: hypothetical protein IKQ17_09230 [Kiritimatiellae bacterium]|nr:hypothetical protein [Kiritimatiellia bacterium]